ncbi:hypothetical protein ACFL2V_14890 [Pseudomonadota bacterium]
MSERRQSLPHASAEMETHVKEVFPVDIEPEVFAAKDGAGWMDFTFNDFRFTDPELDSWIHAVGKIVRDPLLLKEVQDKYLSDDERIDLNNYINDELENIDNN